MSSALRSTATAVTAVLTALTLTACTTGDNAGTEVSFQFHSPGGETEILYEEDQRAPLPDFSGPSLMEEGETINLSDFEDEIVVLNAWGQWCAPCRSESDDLQYVQEQMEEEGIGTVLGINVRDNVRQAPIDFVKDNGITYPSIYDPAFVNAGALGGIPASVIPTTIILDKQHRPAKVFLREVDHTMLMKAVNEVKAEG